MMRWFSSLLHCLLHHIRSLKELFIYSEMLHELKAQKVPRSKKGVHSKPPELKGSSLKCLRGIAPDVVHDLLEAVASGDTSIHELACQCASIKQLSKIQSAFTKATNCSTWGEAKEKYTEFVMPEKLEVFKKLNFNKPTIPAEFLRYCQKAKKMGTQHAIQRVEQTTHSGNHVFALEHESGGRGVFWNHDVLDMNTVEPPITDPPKGGQPPYSGQSPWHRFKSLQL